MLHSYDYSFERKLPNGVWNKVTGTMTASSAKEVERVLISQNAMPLRNIVITQRG